MLDEMVEYTLSHFAFEESLMEKSGYPFAAAHKTVHDSFAARVNQHRERFVQGTDVSKSLMSDLQIWLNNHIRRDDRDYVPYANKVLHKSWLSQTLKRIFGG